MTFPAGTGAGVEDTAWEKRLVESAGCHWPLLTVAHAMFKSP